jgi:OmpA-OmpF porin, OOP family
MAYCPQLISFSFLLILWSSSLLHSQNLAPNPEFEDYTICPANWLNYGEPLPTVPWVQGNAASADYCNSCVIGLNVSVPANYYGFQIPHSGEGYVGILARANIEDYREYIQAQLTEPLVPDQGYYVSFYISLADTLCGSKSFGAYFSNAPPPYDYNQVIDVVPQIESNGAYLNNTHEWTLISGCFIANGGEQYITIGNFRDDTYAMLDPNCIPWTQSSYYYFDDISVVPMDVGDLDLELGEPVVACHEYVIDPGIQDVNYLWSDGTTNPYLVVTES